MNINFSGRTRNIIFIIFLAFTIFLTIIACSAAASQDKLFVADYNQYIKANQLLNQGKYAEAEPILADLAIKQKDTYQVLWLYGLCLAGNGRLAEGMDYMQKARELRPALLMNPIYLVQYGDMLYRMGDYSEAERYIKESTKYKQNSENTKRAKELLQQIKSTRN